MKLTPKQRAFCNEYVKDSNATQAAIRAGYSEETASVSGSRNLKHPRIREIINRKQQRIEERAEVTAEKILKGLENIASDKENPAYARVAAYKALHGCLLNHEKMKAEKKENDYQPPNYWFTIYEDGEHYQMDDHRRMMEEGIPAEPITFVDENDPDKIIKLDENGLPIEDNTPHKIADTAKNQASSEDDGNVHQHEDY